MGIQRTVSRLAALTRVASARTFSKSSFSKTTCFPARSPPACSLVCPRPPPPRAAAKGVDPAPDDGEKPRAVGDEQGDSHDAPDDAEHRQEAAQAVPVQRVPGLEQDFAKHLASGLVA